MSTTILNSTRIATIFAGALATGVVLSGQGPQDDDGATELELNTVHVELHVNDDEPGDRKELLKVLLTLEVQQYDAMSLRDENWKKRPEAFATAKESFSADFRCITGWDELLTLDQHFGILKKTKLDTSKLSDAQLTVINENAVIVSYRLEEKIADQHGGYKTKNRVSSTWVRRGIQWRKVFEQSTPVR